MLIAARCSPLAAADAVALPEGPALTEAVRARDAEFFELVFLGCDPARLRTMLTPDFEMYHDRGGVVARNAEAFVADYDRACRERQRPDAWRSRRELVAGEPQRPSRPRLWRDRGWRASLLRAAGRRAAERLVGRARFTQSGR